MAEAFTWHSYKQNGILQMSSPITVPQWCNAGDLYPINEKDPEVCVVELFFPQPNRFLNISIVVCTQNFLNTCTCSTKTPPLWSQLCVANLSQVPTGMMFWSHFREGFCQTATYDQEWLIPITVWHICLAMFTIIFSIIYYELLWFYLQNIRLSHI